jgi:hypothetical protein
MANEISGSLTLANTEFGSTRTYSLRTSQTLKRRQVITKSVGTAEETLALDADMTSPGLVTVLNKDPTNYVQLGPATTVYLVRLPAAQQIPAEFQLDPSITTLYIKANTAACDVDIEIWGL